MIFGGLKSFTGDGDMVKLDKLSPLFFMAFSGLE